jgi:hypothetical protein
MLVHDLVSYGYWHPRGTAGTGGIHRRAVATGGHARAFCLDAIGRSPMLSQVPRGRAVRPARCGPAELGTGP